MHEFVSRKFLVLSLVYLNANIGLGIYISWAGLDVKLCINSLQCKAKHRFIPVYPFSLSFIIYMVCYE